MKLSELSDERLQVVLAYGFGYITLLIYFILAMTIAIGHIEEKTSFGLTNVLSALGPIGGLFAGWAFGRRKEG
jgi:hypothetical protein